MPTRDPAVRARDFFEVTTGYTEEMALNEAARCLDCKNSPCVAGCPVGVHIPDFIRELKTNGPEAAYSVISLSSTLPAVCGRVCPQESQCEARCVRGIKTEPVAIGRLERYVADYHNAHLEGASEMPPKNGHRVAVVGSGPSGLTCAGDLARMGYEVTVFEALHEAGGVLIYGIPEFRLPKAIVKQEVETLKSLGVHVKTNVVVGRTVTVEELFEEGYEAIFLGSGAGLPRFMGIPG
ncbi:MAG: FAD-dependent oxidoreductase, partial [Clostridia bacterium]|nr:FAD-dependent oxidoreductase [Clostridia bacterium]